MKALLPIFALLLCCGTTNIAEHTHDDEPITLLGTISKWQYPKSKIDGAEMKDAATLNATGNRTVASVLLTTTMTTEDSVEDVIEFYKTLLTRNENNEDKLGLDPDVGRSVMFANESEERPFKFHTIQIVTPTTSTTIIVTRGENEEKTRITWKHYSQL